MSEKKTRTCTVCGGDGWIDGAREVLGRKTTECPFCADVEEVEADFEVDYAVSFLFGADARRLLRPVPPSNQPPPHEAIEPTTTSEVASPAEAIDEVLPCGLRVIAARDASLPVAAVVLDLAESCVEKRGEHPRCDHRRSR